MALVTVRAGRMRLVPKPIEICGVLDTSIDLGDALDQLIMFDPAPDPVAAELVAAELEAFEVPAPAPIVRPAKISLKNAPSSMEQLASQWRGVR